MKKFTVEITETATYQVQVDAESAEQAEEIVCSGEVDYSADINNLVGSNMEEIRVVNEHSASDLCSENDCTRIGAINNLCLEHYQIKK